MPEDEIGREISCESFPAPRPVETRRFFPPAAAAIAGKSPG